MKRKKQPKKISKLNLFFYKYPTIQALLIASLLLLIPIPIQHFIDKANYKIAQSQVNLITTKYEYMGIKFTSYHSIHTNSKGRKYVVIEKVERIEKAVNDLIKVFKNNYTPLDYIRNIHYQLKFIFYYYVENDEQNKTLESTSILPLNKHQFRDVFRTAEAMIIANKNNINNYQVSLKQIIKAKRKMMRNK